MADRKTWKAQGTLQKIRERPWLNLMLVIIVPLLFLGGCTIFTVTTMYAPPLAFLLLALLSIFTLLV